MNTKHIIGGSIVVMVSWSLSAYATPNFPEAIRNDLALDYTPDCNLCHDGGHGGHGGGEGGVTTPFARSVRSYGLVPYNLRSLREALEGMVRDRVDSVGDGTPDTDDLIAGKDPNFATTSDSTAAFDKDVPDHGCAIGSARQTTTWFLSSLLNTMLLASALVASRRIR